jgi:signal transduction histidine kinase/ligand-binding sensor domain-containing protein
MNYREWGSFNSLSPPDTVIQMTQAADGTLWLASGSGLFRFDGLKFISYSGPPDAPLPSTNISAVAALPDESLWIGFALGGAVHKKDTRLYLSSERDGLPQGTVKSFIQDADGAVYVVCGRGIARLEGARWQRIVLQSDDPNSVVMGALFDGQQNLWVVTSSRLLVKRRDHDAFIEVEKLADHQRYSRQILARDRGGTVWAVAIDEGSHLLRLDWPREGSLAIRKFAWKPVSSKILIDSHNDLWLAGEDIRRVSIQALMEDTSGNLLLNTSDTFVGSEAQRSTMNGFFADREENVWVYGETNLGRFSRSKFLRFPNAEIGGGPVAAGNDGVLWMVKSADRQGGSPQSFVEIVNNRQVSQQQAPNGVSAGYRDPDGGVWFGGSRGITNVVHGRSITIPLPPQLGDPLVQAMVRDRDGAMWVSIQERGTYRYLNGIWDYNGKLPGLPRMPAIALTSGNAGDIWFGYPNNVVAKVTADRVTLYGSTEGLRVGNVTAIAIRNKNVWIGGELGLARFDGRQFVSVRPINGNPFSGISGIVETEAGELWLNGNAGIVNVNSNEVRRIVSDANHLVDVEIINYLDGLRGTAVQFSPTPSIVEGTDGRLWFSTSNDLVSVDSKREQRNTLAPPLRIWSLTSDGIEYAGRTTAAIQLPAGSRNVQITYAAGSLSMPENVHFRYMLEGLDDDWQDGGNRREAFFTNLAAGRYTFKVIASNEDGVWNNAGTSLTFSIRPLFYETKWFLSLPVLSVFFLGYGLHRVRVRTVAHRIRGRFEERISERERIARELHDTLLQGGQASILRFQAIANRMGLEDPLRAEMNSALDHADLVAKEGRERVMGLRGSGRGEEFSRAVASFGEDLAHHHDAAFSTSIVGSSRDLQPIVYDEALRIIQEALTNAFSHARASRIEADIEFSKLTFQARIRDNGCGIAPAILSAGGSSGHWGLLGMRERSKLIQGRLQIWSRLGAGTEIHLSIPSSLAYGESKPAGSVWQKMLSLIH